MLLFLFRLFESLRLLFLLLIFGDLHNNSFIQLLHLLAKLFTIEPAAARVKTI